MAAGGKDGEDGIGLRRLGQLHSGDLARPARLAAGPFGWRRASVAQPQIALQVGRELGGEVAHLRSELRRLLAQVRR